MATPTVRVATVVRGDAPPSEPPVETLDSHYQPQAPEGFDPELAKWGAPVSEYRSGLCLAIHSDGGGGKTTLIGTCADSEFGGPVYVLNAGGNPHVIRSRGASIVVKDIRKFSDIEQTRQNILRMGGSVGATGKGFPFRTVCFDVVSEIVAINLRDLYGPTTEVTWQMHSASTAQMKQMVRNWRDLAEHPNYRLNVIFSLWSTTEKRKIRGIEFDIKDLELNKALQGSFTGMVPFVGYLYISDNKESRILDFRSLPTEQVSKFGIDPKDDVMSRVPKMMHKPHLGHIIDVFNGLPWPEELHQPTQTQAPTPVKKG